jgi:hypothetical protein
MTRRVDLGVFTGTNKPFRADLDIILRSNLLVQANSGGGKSWLLRRMIEQSFGRVPQIIIDPEGEFSTLREKFDVVLVGKGGDTPADIRSAKLLAHRLLQLGTSAVIDLFEMSKAQRPLWVATFVQALVDAPKKLWRDLLLYVDEAHELAPEPGHGITESRDEKTCRHALIDFAAKGRKRGYGVVAATQRLGKLSKDFAAELKNVLIGQTFIDIDRERAAGNLGIARANKPEFFNNVKTLEPGAFFALGRAFVLEPTLVTIGDVQTEHPEAGRRQSAPPPPTAKIRHLLPQLADLPKEAEEKLMTEKDLKARIAELERAAKLVPAPIVQKTGKTKPVPVFREADLKRIERFAEKLGDREDGFKALIEAAVDRVAQAQQVVVSSIGNLVALGRQALTPVPPKVVTTTTTKTVQPGRDTIKLPKPFVGAGVRVAKAIVASNGEHALPEKSQRMLGALLQGLAMGLPSMPFKNVAHIAGVSPTSGTTANRKRALIQGGYATTDGANMTITDAGRGYPIDVQMPPTDKKGLLDYWKQEIGTEKVCQMLDLVVTVGSATDEDLAQAADMQLGSGTFANYKRALTGRGLMHRIGKTGPYEPAEAFQR